MLRRIDRTGTPPGGWKYRCTTPPREFSGVQYSLQGLQDQISRFLASNHQPVPHNLEELIEDFTCKELHGKGCEETDDIQGWLERAKLTIKVLLQGTQTIGSWLLAGSPKVSQQQADARSAVCASCVHNIDPAGCAPCQHESLHRLVNELIGNSRSSHHDKLEACDRCGCSLRVKVWLPLEHLKKIGTPFPLPEWCWLRKEES
jgi:hypothetical protein